MIKAKNLTKTYKNGESLLYAVKNVSLEIADGTFAVILGPSGSGKSTLLNLLSGLDDASCGSVFYDDVDIEQLSKSQLTEFRKKTTAFVFQAYYLLPTLNVWQNVKMGADLADCADFGEIIHAVGLGGKEKKFPHELSGGEQQRVSIARALAKNPNVLFCDEPTGALDEETGRKIMKYLTSLQRQKGFTMVMVTHNANFSQLADVTFSMKSGEVVSVSECQNPLSVDEIEW